MAWHCMVPWLPLLCLEVGGGLEWVVPKIGKLQARFSLLEVVLSVPSEHVSGLPKLLEIEIQTCSPPFKSSCLLLTVLRGKARRVRGKPTHQKRTKANECVNDALACHAVNLGMHNSLAPYANLVSNTFT